MIFQILSERFPHDLRPSHIFVFSFSFLSFLFGQSPTCSQFVNCRLFINAPLLSLPDSLDFPLTFLLLFPHLSFFLGGFASLFRLIRNHHLVFLLIPILVPTLPLNLSRICLSTVFTETSLSRLSFIFQTRALLKRLAMRFCHSFVLFISNLSQFVLSPLLLVNLLPQQITGFPRLLLSLPLSL
jgi:hypothetical protein